MQLKSGHRHALCRDGDVLLGLTAGDDPQRIVRQRPLQRLRLILMSALRSLATGSFWRKAAVEVWMLDLPSSTFPKFESYRSVTTTNNNRHSGARVTREARDKRARNP